MRPQTSPSTDVPMSRLRTGRPLALVPMLLLLGVLAIAGLWRLFVIPEVIRLQPALAALGATIVALAMLPSVRAYARTRRREGREAS